MSAKTPIRGVFDSGTATGLAEFQSGEFIALTHGGLGASLSIGSAGQVLKVNSGASALEFGNVEAIVNIDGATDLESATLAASDKLLISDGGTEGRALLSQVDTLFSGTTNTLTNKTISGSANTLSNIGNSSLSNSSVNFGGVTVSLGASDTTPAFDLTDATNYPTSSLTGTITNAQLAGSIENSKLSNSTVSYGGVSLSLGGSNATPAFDLSDATNYPYDSLTGITTNIVGDTTPQLGGNLDVNGNDITGNGNINLTGVVTATSFEVDGNPASLVITSNTTFYVTTSGDDSNGDGSVSSPWATPGKAADFLSQRRIKLGVTVTVSIGSGTYTFTSPIRLDHPQGSQIKYVGATPSGTKPRGNTLNGNSGGAAIRGYTTASESANDTELQTYYNTIWQFNSTTGIKVAPESTLILKDILIRGNNTTGDLRSTDGIRVENGREGGKGGCVDLEDVAIHNFANRGLAFVFGGNGTLTDVTVTNCGGGIVVSSGILLGDLTDIGGTPPLTISNCKGDGINIIRNGTARIQNSVISNNSGNGIDINENGSCRANKSTISNNGKKGVVAQGSSSVQVRAGTVTNNRQNDLLALSNSYIDFRNVGGTSTANKTSPMLNTAGNAGAFIQN